MFNDWRGGQNFRLAHNHACGLDANTFAGPYPPQKARVGDEHDSLGQQNCHSSSDVLVVEQGFGEIAKSS